MKGYFSRWRHVLYHVNLDRERGTPDEYLDVDGYGGANVVSSQILGSPMHTVVVDLDVPATLVPSETPGHSHLFIDVPMTFLQYRTLIGALAQCGVIQQGYADASIARGFTAVRLPWIAKSTEADEVPVPQVIGDLGEFWAQGNSIETGDGNAFSSEEPIF